MTASVSIQSVFQRYGTAVALDAVSLEIAAGEFVVLLGPSGCGKTTLLNIIGGFAEPTSGQVLIGGRDMAGVAPKDRPTTTVFQDYALFPHMSLRDNVGFGLRMRGVSRGDRAAKADAMLALVGLEGRGDRRPHELSGGQRQRVALARALAVEPDVLLLDEPLGALDLKLRRQMQDELKAIQRRVGTTFVHVTHDQEEAMAIADRIVVMNGGRVEDFGPPRQVYLQPKSLFAANFMGEVNLVPVVGGRAPFGPVPVDDGTLCLRPEAISATGSLHIGLCRVEDVAFFGTHVRAHVTPLTAPDLRLVVHLPQSLAVEVGMVLDLGAESHVVLNG
ncbi:ABC transporter ATP-binding protein [Tabrizicola sp.]|uniref:ABC transporter ATP-binding protein n=1 Tax=Tabrizicola sp. TaxID=2005166 RepID=UPI003451CCEA